jgi:uncharacterized OB-fold protein
MSLPATLPAITAGNAGFWEHALRGELALPHCGDCGHAWFPPSDRCPACLSANVGFRRASGRGTLHSWIVMHRPYFRDFPPPYVVAWVRLEEGPMMVAGVVAGCEGRLRCDLPVVAAFERLSAEVAVPRFAPAE